MKANELRVNNWVNVTDKDYQITQILERGINCGIVGAMYDIVKPIPLTEEWLERFGFEDLSKERYSNYYKNNGKVWILNVTIGTENWWCGSPSDINGKSKHLRNVEFVHQLQNLYFALTGQELELKE